MNLLDITSNIVLKEENKISPQIPPGIQEDVSLHCLQVAEVILSDILHLVIMPWFHMPLAYSPIT